MTNALKIIGVWLIAICVCLLVGCLDICAWDWYRIHSVVSHPKFYMIAYGFVSCIYLVVAYIAIAAAVIITADTLDPGGGNDDVVGGVITGLYYLFAITLAIIEDQR